MLKLLFSGQATLALRVLRTCNEFYRACFVSTAISNGIYENFRDGPMQLDQLCEGLDSEFSREGLEAWLNLGVSLGELKLSVNGYTLKGRLSRKLSKDSNDAYQALLQEIVENHYPYIIHTPSMLKEQKTFPFDESIGQLIARSSRISEPFIIDALESTLPTKGAFRLLEVGCGSGIYIKHACKHNRALSAVGLELQSSVADFAQNNIRTWGLDERVIIEHCNIWEYPVIEAFDLVTLHQNIYYFPVKKRVDLAKHLSQYIKPGGRLMMTTACQGGNPALQTLNIWVSITDGYGPLPHREQLCSRLEEAGFCNVHSKRLLPGESFYAFFGTKSEGEGGKSP